MRYAIVNAKYVRLGGAGARRVHGLIDYVTRESEAVRGRELGMFASTGEDLSRREAHRWVDRVANSQYAYTLVLSPAPGVAAEWDDVAWREWTRSVMKTVADEWVAVVHEDVTHPHVHVIAIRDTTIPKTQLTRILDYADREAERIMREVEMERGVELDAGRGRVREREVEW